MSLILESDKLIKGVGRINNRGQGGFFSAIHIEYIAVIDDLHGLGLGTDMMQRALLSFRQAVIDFGAPVLTLVPITDKLVEYYKRLGFVSYGVHTGQRRMMLTAHQAIAALNI
jgi:ribosomal protein S18 acetylase RimI-like enzyme